jgi:hypothetical protein
MAEEWDNCGEQSPGVTYRVWSFTNIDGPDADTVQGMMDDGNMGVPHLDELSVLEVPDGPCSSCGMEMLGWFSPAVDGPHTFRLAADDGARLWIGGTQAEAEASEPVASVTDVAGEPGWTEPQEWDKFEAQTSAPIELKARRQYFIRVVKDDEHSGSNHLAVGVTTPRGDFNPLPIVGPDGHAYLYPEEQPYVGADTGAYLKVEGDIACWHRPGCDFEDTVIVRDGKLTVTGNSHNSGTCHSIGRVRVQFAPPLPNPVATDLEIYFGTELPEGASNGAILDLGLGFANHVGGYNYGWDCDGDLDVNFSSGRLGVETNNGLGLNHFDRESVCAGDTSWQVAVPNGLYTVQVHGPAKM